MAALQDRDLRVWYDAFEIRLGDDFRLKMEEGLTGSRFGVVVLSPSFFKHWPQKELSVLHTLEAAHGEKRILPLAHAIDWQELVQTVAGVAVVVAAAGFY